MLPVVDLFGVDLLLVNRVSSVYKIGVSLFICSLSSDFKSNFLGIISYFVKVNAVCFVFLWNIIGDSFFRFDCIMDSFNSYQCSYYSLNSLDMFVGIQCSYNNCFIRNWFSNFSGLSFMWNDTLLFSCDVSDVSLHLLYGLLEDFYVLELSSCVFLSKILMIYYCSYVNSLLLAWYDNVVLGSSIIDFTMLHDGKDCRLLLTCF